MIQFKIKQYLFFLSFILATLVPIHKISASTDMYSLFDDVSYYDYDLYWSLLKIGSAQLKFDTFESENDLGKLYRTTFTIKTNALIDAIYPVETHIESTSTLVDEKIKPVSYKKTSREGTKTVTSKIFYDYNLNQIIEENNESKLQPIKITKDLTDPLNLVFSICSNNFKKNSIFQKSICDGGKTVLVKTAYTGTELISTKVGEFKTQVVQLNPSGLRGVFKKSPNANINIYLSENLPAIPIKLESRVKMGNFYAVLKNGKYKGKKILGEEKLKYQNIFIEPRKENRYFKR